MSKVYYTPGGFAHGAALGAAISAVAYAYAFFIMDQTQPVATAPANIKNKAFVFVKPHACTEQGVNLVRETLKMKGFNVNREGDISSEEIDKEKLIDQHYYAIASKATLMKPSELNVPADKFQQTFGVAWADVLKQEVAYNALDDKIKIKCGKG